MKKFFYLLFFMVFLMQPGCAKKVDLGPGYDKTSKQFLQAMRWKDFQGAAGYLKVDDRQKLLDSFENLKDLNIVEADFHYSRLNKEEQTAKSKIVLKYYLLPSTRIKEWSWEMDWLLIPAGTKKLGAWQVQSAPPQFP